MKKPLNRRERIEFICQKKGKHISDIFTLMTDHEVKVYFDYIYPVIKEKPDVTAIDESVQCIRCGSNVEIEFNTYCQCGMNRAVYSSEDWKRQIKQDMDDDIELSDEDKTFISNGYKL